MEEKKEIKVKNLFFASQIVDITLENIKNSKRSKINLNELEKKVRKERNSRFQKSHKILYIYIYKRNISQLQSVSRYSQNCDKIMIISMIYSSQPITLPFKRQPRPREPKIP